MPLAFLLVVEESEGSRIEHSVEATTYPRDRLYEHRHTGIIAAVKPVIVSPHMASATLVIIRGDPADDGLEEMADRKLLGGGGAGLPIAPGASGLREPAGRAERACRASPFFDRGRVNEPADPHPPYTGDRAEGRSHTRV